MKKLNSRERVLVIFCALFVLYGGWLVTHPSKPAGAQRVLLPTEQANEKAEVARRTWTRIVAEQADMEPRIARAAYDMPPEQLMPRVIRDLQRIANRSGVHLNSIKPLRAKDLGAVPASRVPLEVRFSASFQPQVIRFLYFVEDPAGKLVVDRISVNSSDTKVKTVDVTAQVSVFTRWVAEAAGGGAAKNAKSNVGQSG